MTVAVGLWPAMCWPSWAAPGRVVPGGGADVRRTVSTTAYTAVCYPVAAVVLLIVCVASGQRLGGYTGSTWLRLAALALLAQILGHSVFNLVLRTVSPTIVSVALLFEIVGAAVLAAIFLNQDPPRPPSPPPPSSPSARSWSSAPARLPPPSAAPHRWTDPSAGGLDRP